MVDLNPLAAPETEPVSGRASANTTNLFRLGAAAVTVLFGGLLLWSIFAPFEGAVLASGSISVESNQQAVQHLEGGIVGQIFVKEGDRVEEGQPLISLDDTTVDARLSSIEARLFELLSREARLVAERDRQRAPVLRAGVEELEENVNLQSVLRSQAELMRARAASRSTQVELLKQTVLQLERRVTGRESEIVANRKQSSLVQEEIDTLQPLVEKKLVTRPRIVGLQREIAQLEGAREALISEVATTKIQIGEAEIELNQLTEGFIEEVLTELRDVQTEVAELLEQRTASLDQQRRLLVISPRAGRVIGVRTHTVGGVIPPRDPIMHVVPENDRLIARVRISPSDIDKVSMGNEAVLRFPAFSANVTPEVYGTVVDVSADAIQDEATGQFFFEGFIEIPEDRLANERFALQPGMPVDASVTTESRTVISYLLKPLGDAMAKTFRE